MMSRRIFTAALAAVSMGTLEAATGTLMPRLARAENGSAARNVVLVCMVYLRTDRAGPR